MRAWSSTSRRVFMSLQGENAQGKTNLLEAIYYLATTRSPLAVTDRQLIHWAADEEVIPYARVEGLFCARRAASIRSTSHWSKSRQPNGERRVCHFRRQIRLDGVPRRAMDVVGQLNVVLFLPEDIASGGRLARRAAALPRYHPLPDRSGLLPRPVAL